MSEFHDSTPIYRQIASQIRDGILAGNLREGDQIMSTTQYATTYRINPATAAKAMNQLVDERLLDKRRGIGMFVAAGAQAALRNAMRAEYFIQTLEPALARADLLGIPRAALIHYMEERK